MRCTCLSPAGLSPRHQRGASLIEVLIAIVVLSTGLLGMAGLLYGAMRHNHAAYLRSQGVALAADVLDRMRAHGPACAGPAMGPSCPFTQGRSGSDASAGPACGEPLPAGMAAPALATADFLQWRNCLAQALPGGYGAVTHVAEGVVYAGRCGNGQAVAPVPAPMPLFVVEVHWAEHRLPTEGDVGHDCVVLSAGVGT
ncbi:MAG: type IV pilus modification protein PilV [Hydrogenophaga sp.]|uniref:type IV pilus modification protein PilV n=1 Tax=Hydrogenophaga sp. TaxID=1904254 RepID=UPI00260CDAC1|nr:type IV pilus modification protein PilV [Hydrogenophaga sp.]MDD3786384.1 type IV pilus modification protein PilV [Hydrogenophaga sp.]MDX9970141.1 type IV pilus modification protein PilV [Hydrogenophaga sp.]